MRNLSFLQKPVKKAVQQPATHVFRPYICKKDQMQTTAKRSAGLYWILFIISVIVFFGVYAVGGGYCSMILPFNVTFLALALDLIDRQ